MQAGPHLRQVPHNDAGGLTFQNQDIAAKMILRLTARELSAKCNAAFGRQSSSGVEQRTHKPLVGGSIPSSGTSLRGAPKCRYGGDPAGHLFTA